MRSTIRCAVCCSCLLLTSPDFAGGGHGRARAASRRGWLFSFLIQNLLVFDPTPHLILSLQHDAHTNPEPTAGSIKCNIFCFLAGEGVVISTSPNPMCHRTSNLKDDINLLRDYSIHLPSRDWGPG